MVYGKWTWFPYWASLQWSWYLICTTEWSSVHALPWSNNGILSITLSRTKCGTKKMEEGWVCLERQKWREVGSAAEIGTNLPWLRTDLLGQPWGRHPSNPMEQASWSDLAVEFGQPSPPVKCHFPETGDPKNPSSRAMGRRSSVHVFPLGYSCYICRFKNCPVWKYTGSNHRSKANGCFMVFLVARIICFGFMGVLLEVSIQVSCDNIPRISGVSQKLVNPSFWDKPIISVLFCSDIRTVVVVDVLHL
jgi:hypothetical protein